MDIIYIYIIYNDIKYYIIVYNDIMILMIIILISIHINIVREY